MTLHLEQQKKIIYIYTLALTYDLTLMQMANSSINHNEAYQMSIRIFLCLEQREVKYSAVSDKKIPPIPSVNKMFLNDSCYIFKIQFIFK